MKIIQLPYDQYLNLLKNKDLAIKIKKFSKEENYDENDSDDEKESEEGTFLGHTSSDNMRLVSLYRRNN